MPKEWCCSLVFLILTLIRLSQTNLIKCHSCQASCGMKIEECEKLCKSKLDECMGKFCFTRLDTLENFYHYLQSGCSNFAPEGKNGTYDSGRMRAPVRYQYCDKAFCNDDFRFLEKNPADLATTDEHSCCELSFEDYYHYDEAMDWKESCPSECRSPYCMTDHVNSAKTCSSPYPVFYADLNTATVGNMPDAMCVRYSATVSYATHMCTCKTTDAMKLCNEHVTTPSYSRENLVKCYNCLQTATGAIPSPLCDDFCWGSSCFLTITSADILQAFDYTIGTYGPPKLESGKYEVIAGCISYSLPSAQSGIFRQGCRVEWLNASDPISRHCLCQENNCNTLEFALGYKPPGVNEKKELEEIVERVTEKTPAPVESVQSTTTTELPDKSSKTPEPVLTEKPELTQELENPKAPSPETRLNDPNNGSCDMFSGVSRILGALITSYIVFHFL